MSIVFTNASSELPSSSADSVFHAFLLSPDLCPIHSVRHCIVLVIHTLHCILSFSRFNSAQQCGLKRTHIVRIFHHQSVQIQRNAVFQLAMLLQPMAYNIANPVDHHANHWRECAESRRRLKANDWSDTKPINARHPISDRNMNFRLRMFLNQKELIRVVQEGDIGITAGILHLEYSVFVSCRTVQQLVLQNDSVAAIYAAQPPQVAASNGFNLFDGLN